MPAFLRFSPRVLAAVLAATALFLPVASRAQNVPPYAAAPAQDQQIHGRIASIDGTFNLTVQDDNGYLDAIQLQQGTIINPTGLTLAPGMIVTVIGYPNGSVFNAVEIDTPYNYSGPAPTPAYYGPGWWYPGFAYGYGPSFSLVIAGGGFTCYQQPWVGHWYGSSPPWGNHNGSGYGGNNPAKGGYGNGGMGYGGNNGKGGYGGTSGGYNYGPTNGKGNGGNPVYNPGNGGTSVGNQGNGTGKEGNGGTSVGNEGNGGTSVGNEGKGGTSTGFASGYGYHVTPTTPHEIAPVRQINVPGGIATYRSPANSAASGGTAYRAPSSSGTAYRAPSYSGSAYRAPSSGAGYRAPAPSAYRAPAASSYRAPAGGGYRAPSGGGGSHASSGGGSHASGGGGHR
jgi:hypothetical protein